MNINEIKKIRIGDEFYPEKLLHIYAPPQELYVLGDTSILNEKGIAIIGCRDCSDYGKKVSYYFAKKLANKNINIISGLARGIDAIAHKGAIDVKGKTIGVLGCGLDVVYQPENKELYKQIIKSGGAIITEYHLGTKPLKHNFPARNRIISGLSDGVLVIEAKKRSGTLNTASHALEQGKDVFVIPRRYF